MSDVKKKSGHKTLEEWLKTNGSCADDIQEDLKVWMQTNEIPEFFALILNKKTHIHSLDSLKECVCELKWTEKYDWKELIFDETGEFSRDLPQEVWRAFLTFIRSIQSLKSDCISTVKNNHAKILDMKSGNPYIVIFS